MKDVELSLRFSSQLEPDIAKGIAGPPDTAGRYVQDHGCPRCGAWVPLTHMSRATLIARGLTITGSTIVNGRIKIGIAMRHEALITTSQCQACGQEPLAVVIAKDGAMGVKR